MGAIQGLATMGPDSYNEVGSENINLRALITLFSAPHKGKRSYLAQGGMSEFPSSLCELGTMKGLNLWV